MSKDRFVIVSADVLPEVILKVLEAKKLIAQGVCRTSTEACKKADVSRSAYYKYKDSVHLYSERLSGRVVTYYFTLYDRAGVLSGVLAQLHRSNANILTINQNIPIDSAATVTITVRFDDPDIDPQAICDAVKKADGVVKAKIITGSSQTNLSE